MKSDSGEEIEGIEVGSGRRWKGEGEGGGSNSIGKRFKTNNGKEKSLKC